MDENDSRPRYARNLMELRHYPAEPEDPNGRMLTLEEAIAESRKERGIDTEHEEALRTIWEGLSPINKKN